MLKSRLMLAYYILDALAVLAALKLASVLRISLDLGTPGPDWAFATPTWLYAVAVVIWMFALQKSSVYHLKYSRHLSVELWNVMLGNFTASLLFFGILYVGYRDFSRLQAFYVIAFTLAFTGGYRVIGHLLRPRVHRLIPTTQNVIVVGRNENAARVAQQVIDNTNLHLLGYVGMPHDQIISGLMPGLYLGEVDDLERLTGDRFVHEVIIAFKWYDQQVSNDISQIMLLLQGEPINVRLAPDYSELVFFHLSTENFQGIPLIGLREPVFSPMQRLIKRTFDLAVALTVLFFTWPLLLLIAVAIRAESAGSVIFNQRRIGTHGKPFNMYKFRSMYAQIDQANFDETRINVMKKPNDPRVTRVGHFLRRTSLDELPQLFNVLRGDMSIVGPRPELPDRVREYEWWQSKRFEVPQGMTGWWQINGRANRPMHLHTEDDLYYIENYSLWLDMKIIMRTCLVVVTGEGAF